MWQVASDGAVGETGGGFALSKACGWLRAVRGLPWEGWPGSQAAMRTQPLRLTLAGLAFVLAGCATAYRWGATDDPEWTPRVGSATFAQAQRELGQPFRKLPLPSGDMKVRWYARPITMSETRGTMEDNSVQHVEERAYW